MSMLKTLGGRCRMQNAGNTPEEAALYHIESAAGGRHGQEQMDQQNLGVAGTRPPPVDNHEGMHSCRASVLSMFGMRQ